MHMAVTWHVDLKGLQQAFEVLYATLHDTDPGAKAQVLSERKTDACDGSV